MFKFLFSKKKPTVVETQRDTVKRAVDELNSILALMADKPVIGVDLNSGLITVELPDQMPDEALALPAPVEPPKEEGVSEEAADKDVADTDEAGAEAADKDVSGKDGGDAKEAA